MEKQTFTWLLNVLVQSKSAIRVNSIINVLQGNVEWAVYNEVNNTVCKRYPNGQDQVASVLPGTRQFTHFQIHSTRENRKVEATEINRQYVGSSYFSGTIQPLISESVYQVGIKYYNKQYNCTIYKGNVIVTKYRLVLKIMGIAKQIVSEIERAETRRVINVQMDVTIDQEGEALLMYTSQIETIKPELCLKYQLNSEIDLQQLYNIKNERHQRFQTQTGNSKSSQQMKTYLKGSKEIKLSKYKWKWGQLRNRKSFLSGPIPMVYVESTGSEVQESEKDSSDETEYQYSIEDENLDIEEKPHTQPQKQVFTKPPKRSYTITTAQIKRDPPELQSPQVFIKPAASFNELPAIDAPKFTNEALSNSFTHLEEKHDNSKLLTIPFGFKKSSVVYDELAKKGSDQKSEKLTSVSRSMRRSFTTLPVKQSKQPKKAEDPPVFNDHFVEMMLKVLEKEKRERDKSQRIENIRSQQNIKTAQISRLGSLMSSPSLSPNVTAKLEDVKSLPNINAPQARAPRPSVLRSKYRPLRGSKNIKNNPLEAKPASNAPEIISLLTKNSYTDAPSHRDLYQITTILEPVVAQLQKAKKSKKNFLRKNALMFPQRLALTDRQEEFLKEVEAASDESPIFSPKTLFSQSKAEDMKQDEKHSLSQSKFNINPKLAMARSYDDLSTKITIKKSENMEGLNTGRSTNRGSRSNIIRIRSVNSLKSAKSIYSPYDTKVLQDIPPLSKGTRRKRKLTKRKKL